MRHAGQHQAGLFLFVAQAWPFNLIADVAADEGADAGAAGAVSAGAGWVNQGCLTGLQDGLAGVCGEVCRRLQVAWL